MNRTFNFRQSQELLRVDPKTFGRWLEKAQIDPEKQVNRADPRQKWLTEEQLRILAREHGRELPPQGEENEPESPGVTLTTLDERLAAIEHLIAQCFTDLNRKIANLEQQFTATTLGSQVEGKSSSTPTADVSVPASRLQPIRKPTAAKKSTKKTARGKRLPKNLVPLAAFRAEHGISEKAVEYALGKKRITVERGKWVHDNRNVIVALGQLGQSEFYALFNEREGFHACKRCPHAI